MPYSTTTSARLPHRLLMFNYQEKPTYLTPENLQNKLCEVAALNWWKAKQRMMNYYVYIATNNNNLANFVLQIASDLNKGTFLVSLNLFFSLQTTCSVFEVHLKGSCCLINLKFLLFYFTYIKLAVPSIFMLKKTFSPTQ